MGDPAASKFVIKGDRVHTVCDCYKPTQLVLYSPLPPSFWHIGLCIVKAGQIAEQLPCTLRQHRCNSAMWKSPPRYL